MLIVLRNKKNRFFVSLLAAYVFLVIADVLLTRNFGGSIEYELIPFWSYHAILFGTDITILYQVIANIIMFIPIGILLPYSFKIRKLTILIGFSLSCLFEVMQLVLRCGLFEFDDIMHNTLGTFIGYVLYLLIERIRHGVSKKGDNQL